MLVESSLTAKAPVAVVVQLPEVDVEAFQVFERWIVRCSMSAGWRFTLKQWLDELEELDLQLLYKCFLLIDSFKFQSFGDYSSTPSSKRKHESYLFHGFFGLCL